MAYNRYSNVGGGYPTGSNNIYNQPMPPMPPHQHHQHPQYPHYNRNSAGWNMQPGPPLPPPQGQGINPWVNNNIPQSFRGYNPMHDNRNHMKQPNLRLSQVNKRPNDWNNTPNKRPRTIGGNNLNNSNTNNNQQQQQTQAQQNLNKSNPKIKKTWVNYNNNNNNKNRNFKRRNNNREVKINDKTQDKTPAKKEVPVENVTVSDSNTALEFDSTQGKHFKNVSGFLCSLCDVFLKDKNCAIEHSKAEPHQAKFKEFNEKAAAEAEKQKEKEASTESNSESKEEANSSGEAIPKTNGTEENGDDAADESKTEDTTLNESQNESTLVDESAVLSSADTTLDVSKGPVETSSETPLANAPNSEDVIALVDDSTVSEVAESDDVQPVANRGGKGPRGRGRGRSRGRGRR